MNAEYLWWFVILVAVGVGVVVYLAMGPVPEIPGPAAPATDRAAPATLPAAPATEPAADPSSDSLDPEQPDGGHSSPVSTTVPGPDAPSSTSETP